MMILSYDYAQISGYKVHQRTRKGQIIILSYDYAQNIRILKTRKGHMTIFSYDYSRISGYEFSEEKKAPRMSGYNEPDKAQ